MNNKNILIILIVLVIFGGLFWYGSFSANLQPETASIANPASEFCVNQGGVSQIITNDDGSQAGVCVFSDGSQCDEWAFYRGECAMGNK